MQIFLKLVNQLTPSTDAECEAFSLDKAIEVFIPDIKVKLKYNQESLK